MSDVFLSYSREDQAIARRYAEALQRAGLSVWWDQALHPGEAFDEVTEKALEQARAVVVLWSRASVSSRWVRAEATQASANGRLVPAMIEPCKRPIMFELTHAADLAGWSGDDRDPRWLAFIESLRRNIRGPGNAGESGMQEAASGAAQTTRPVQLVAMPGGKRRLAIAGAVSVLAVALAAIALLVLRRDGVAGGADSSVVVLPFDDASPQPGQADYGAGMANAIRDTLDRISGLTVTPSTSSIAIKERAGDLGEVRRTLGVRYMLEGAASRDGDQLHVGVRLIDLESGRGIWSGNYDPPARDIFGVQKEIAASVARALQLNLGVGIGEQPGMTRDVEAYDAFLRANVLRARLSYEGWHQALQLMEQAVARDPGFAQAWWAISNLARDMAIVMAPEQYAAEASSLQRKSAQALEKYQDLMSGTVELEYVLAQQAMQNGRLLEAAKLFQSIESNTDRVMFGGTPPNVLGYVGKVREAITVTERARAIDPLNSELAGLLAQAYSANNDPQAAAAEFERAERLSGGDDANLRGRAVSAALGAKDARALRRWLDAILAMSPVPGGEFTIRISDLLDEPEQARSYLHSSADDPGLTPLAAGVISIYLAYFGDPEGALGICSRYGTGCLRIIDIWQPVHREMRQLPAAHKLMREAGLVDYWREFGPGDFCSPTKPDWEEFECR